MQAVARGKFITLEGIDGAGKSSLIPAIEAFLVGRGIAVRMTREPGGTPLGESLRKLLLGEAMALDTETLLMFAARAEHLDKVIRPALASGSWVVSDRFTDATFAYQGGGRGLPFSRLKALEEWVHGDVRPDLTLFFDVPVAVGMARRGSATPGLDRFEREDPGFFQRVREAYLERASQEPARFKIVSTDRALEAVKENVENVLVAFCSR
ncbi:MAG: dTMP kinase [Burkholderiales bacterium]